MNQLDPSRSLPAGSEQNKGPSRRTVATTAAWAVPAVVVSVASPALAASGAPSLAIAGVPTSIAFGGAVTGATVTVTANGTSPVEILLPDGFVWADGTTGQLRTIGTGPGVFTIPAFTHASATGQASLLASSAGATATAVMTVVAAPVADYSATVLGAMNIISDGPDEFRADFSIVAPPGAFPSKLYYRWNPTGTGAINRELFAAADNRDIRSYVDQNYKVMVQQTLSSSGTRQTRWFFSVRGDSDVGNVPTATYQWPVRVVWSTGKETIVEFPVLHQHLGDDGRPVAINAWDTTTSSLPGYDKTLSSEAAWGNLVMAGSNGTLNGNWFHIDALSSWRSAAVGNDVTSSAYYQFVHEDGTPASVTPTPKLVSFPSHSGIISVGGVLLGSQLGTSFTLDKPGYYRLLAWPQSSNSRSNVSATPAGVAWDPAVDAGHQVGSVFWKIPYTV